MFIKLCFKPIAQIKAWVNQGSSVLKLLLGLTVKLWRSKCQLACIFLLVAVYRAEQTLQQRTKETETPHPDLWDFISSFATSGLCVRFFNMGAFPESNLSTENHIHMCSHTEYPSLKHIGKGSGSLVKFCFRYALNMFKSPNQPSCVSVQASLIRTFYIDLIILFIT